ncbi:MAG: phosphoenolpyruvate hydrolase family protein [Caldiserica bacterium]|jgi:predicted TIM-barrel enzyme|nr:phosphoenolpyruvate hydrolase family protein [Caldisericota bacterium]MDH7562708.1 phosphoenolpyruvate hydrolase family protein [Caldisericota bacterium]
MAKRYSREEVIARLKGTLKAGKPIIIAGAGDGFIAKLEEKGGVDIIGVYNSGWFRHYGVGSLGGLLPMGDTNRMVVELAYEVLPRVKEAIVIAGVCAQDPRTIWDAYLDDLLRMGFSGVMNFPTVGLIDANSKFRKNLEESGFGFDKEAAVLKMAHDKGIFTIGYCFTPEEARMIAKAGVDILACHVGLTAGGLIGATTVTSIEESIKITNELINAAKEVRPEMDFFPITHGGPMEDPESTAKVLAGTEAVGYLGASSVERTPVEKAVVQICQEYKAMPVNIPGWLKL